MLGTFAFSIVLIINWEKKKYVEELCSSSFSFPPDLHNNKMSALFSHRQLPISHFPVSKTSVQQKFRYCISCCLSKSNENLCEIICREDSKIICIENTMD